MMRTALPVLADLTTARGWQEIGASQHYAALGQRLRLYPLAEIRGDDAGCRAVAKPLAPHYLGVPRSFISRGGFGFAALAAPCGGNPWEMLLQYDERNLPVFLDANSSRWIWRRNLGDTLPLAAALPQAKIVGLMRPNIFAGMALAAEEALRRTGKVGEGYRMFVVESEPSLSAEEASQALAAAFSAYGPEIKTTDELMQEQRRVEDIYRAAFGLLAACGLLFGLCGMAAIVIRHGWERRRELAMLMATGWQHSQIAWLLAAENAGLALTGLAIGASSMLLALPWFSLAQPWTAFRSLAATLASASLLAALCSWLAARAALSGDLVAALRAE
ncbi:MAG: hypothetical protein N3A66_09120 [Planctomycetota bacterium]|nr:hypothetical protein [Planctomycetota bacterium]